MKGKEIRLGGSKPSCIASGVKTNTKTQIQPKKETKSMGTKHTSKMEVKFKGWWVVGVFALHLGLTGQYPAQPYVLE